MDTLNQALVDYYRCPETFVRFALGGELSGVGGYFRFGPDAICYGECSAGLPSKFVTEVGYDALNDIMTEDGRVRLVFNPTEIVDNLRFELYATNNCGGEANLTSRRVLRNAYYFARPLMPVWVRKYLQRMSLRGWEKIKFPSWPVDRTVDRILERLLILSLKTQRVATIPFIWFWPDGYPSCAIMTHDVETSSGRDFCSQLMDMNDRLAIKSSFQIIPEERYTVSPVFLSSVRNRGFEINIHDLNHDGHLFSEREQFLRRANRINHYARQYDASGFRSAALYRNPNWYDAFDFSYDMSFPNVAHLDPQRGGCCTVMPFFIRKILELPLTATQDYSLFYILNDFSLELWKRQIELIMDKHGLISFIVHPDYIIEKRARNTYQSLIDYLAELRSAGKVWIALPHEVDRWWRERSQMKLVQQGDTYQIEGPGKERARIAYASCDGDRVVYTVEKARESECSRGLPRSTEWN